MKQLYKFLIPFLSIFNISIASAQQTNSWINYNQQYYKINVFVDGLYRITPTVLNSSGIDLTNIHPKNFQIFGRGKEIPIYVENENDTDGVFNSNDFIEFYGLKNDGWADSLVYDNSTNAFSPYISLFNDTATYYLTWNNDSNNQHIINVTDTNFLAYNDFNYFISKRLYGDNISYTYGKTNSFGTFDPEFTEAEGYGYSFGSPQVFALSTVFPYTNGPDFKIKCNIASFNQDFNTINDHRLILHRGNPSLGNLLIDTIWDGIKNLQFSFNFSPIFVPGTMFINVTPVSTGSSCGTNMCYSYMYYEYARLLNMNNTSKFFMFFPNDSTQLKSKYSFTNFNSTTPVWFYDFTNKQRTLAINNGTGNYTVLSENFGNEKKCYITSESNIINVTNLTPVTNTGFFTNYSIQQNANYLIVTHKKVIQSATNYANYRNQKGYNTLLADIDELYDQFSYGIRKNPLALRKFVEFTTINFDSVPKHILLIGKGILSVLNRNDTANYRACLIPTWGYYGSDNLITAKIQGSNGYAPRIAIGRIAATNNQEVEDYLQKVQQYEAAPKQFWMKNVLHFAGGTSIGEQNQFLYFLNQYKSYFEDTLYGGKVTTFKKTTVNPIQIAQADSIKKIIENGVSFMNFFGHAAGSSFDVSPEPPNSYNNIGKYPFVMANSCNVGDIHQPASATYQFVSEEYIFIPQKGAIGFLAQSAPGLAGPNGIFSAELVKNITQKMYGKSIGECINDAINTVQQPNDDLLKETCLTMTLHGDPAIKPNYFDSPDFSINQNSILFEPTTVTTDIDSFKVIVIIKNEGSATNKNLLIQVKRYLPDSLNFYTYIKTIVATKFIDTLYFKLPTKQILAGGTNKLEINIDPLNSIQEISETNNQITVNFDIISKDIIPVYPYNFSVIPKNNLILKASTLNPFAIERNYKFEIDTTDLFNSNFKLSNTITQAGGIVKWELPITLSDSLVYFWRVSPDSNSTTQFNWKESSFQYIKNKKGWGQSQFYQFKNNKFDLVKYNRLNRSFDFGTLTKSIIGRTFTAPNGQIPSIPDLFATEYRIGAELIESAGNSFSPALHVAVIDSATLEPWEIQYTLNGVLQNPNNNFGNSNNGQSAQNHLKYFIFRPSSTSQMQGLKNMLLNAVPNGNYILVYTWIRGDFQAWADTSLRTVFENLGSDSVRYLPNNRGWIFFCQKGHPSTALETNNSSPGRFELSLSADMISNITNGNFSSDIIGPASRWDTLFWKAKSYETPTNDFTKLEVIGIKNNGNLDTLYSNNLQINKIPLSNINAITYPYLKLNFFNKDSITQSSSQLKNWHILYEPAPECALNTNEGFVVNNTEVQQGEKFKMTMPITNISDANMDSLLIKYWIEKPDKSIIELPFPRQDSLLVNESQLPTISIDTKALLGNYKLWIEANPFVTTLNKYDQLEQYHFNNKASTNFSVVSDKLNPLLDVTFDGYHIMDGDIVSPKAIINIELKDENKFLALNDTSNFRVFITNTNNSVPQRIYFTANGVEQLKFTKGVLPDNKARIEYASNFKIDGTYKLTLQANDVSGNKSGINDYSINFEVINKSSITQVMNYPNPFSSSTKFVFTLTGSELPTWFKIQILTVSGKVVKEITQQELGQIKIGKNITEYSWNGTDEYGDPLGNGVYFYKVFTEIDNKEIERRESGADQFFKNEFGKIYLMR